MSTRKKRFILGLTGGVMALGLVGVIASQNTFNIGIGVHAEDPNNVLWKHYAAVEPTTTRHGSKEFWANCSELGTHSLTKPAKGKIEEGGDFSATSYFAELNPSDNRYVAKFSYSEVWTTEGFTVQAPSTLESVKNRFVPKDFTKTDNDGWIMILNDNSAFGSITLPKTNFHELLKGGKIARTEIGGYNTSNVINMEAGGDKTIINANGGNATEQCAAALTKTSLTFYEDSKGTVRMNYVDTLIENPCSGGAKYGEIKLTESEANGTTGLKITSSQKGETRVYWLGKLRLTDGESVYKDFSGKKGFVADAADLYTQEETTVSGVSPFGQWKAPIAPYSFGIGIRGNSDKEVKTTTLTFDKFNVNDVLNSGKGLRFTLGAWNGNETIWFIQNGKKVSLGKNGPGMAGNKDALHTKQTIEYTWRNWQISIDRTGLHVYNAFENKTYDCSISDNQSNGTESLIFNLANNSYTRFFLLTNMVTYTL